MISHKKIKSTLLLGGLAFCFYSYPSHLHATADEQTLIIGKKVYEAHCARCHGLDGKGAGSDWQRLPVRPRDLTSGKFKFKSTMSGTPPTDADIKYTLTKGLAGSGMPSFANLDNVSMNGVIQYIKSFSTIFNEYQPKPLANPSNMKGKVDLKKGQEIYAKLQCALCHGNGGRANGASAFTLNDSWGFPIKPANLEHGWTYRGGSKPIDVYHRIMAGIEGAPMPSYDGAVSPEDAWQLSNYVSSLQLDANWIYEIIAVKVDSLPATYGDPKWERAPKTNINLQGYHYKDGKMKQPSIKEISAQVLLGQDHLAFRLSWADPVLNDKTTSDAMMISVFPKNHDGDPRANLHSLYTPNSSALDVMLWKASEPTIIGQGNGNLSAVTRPGWIPTNSYNSTAEYKDGLWTLVFTLPLGADSPFGKDSESRIGFSAWDGYESESGLDYSASQWIRLIKESKGIKHH
ncbi:MAG: c-type cytochrome [Elusimicrobiota bacterium]